MTEKKKTEKETKRIATEDVEKFFRDVWGKVVEYASLGAEEATKVSATAKTRVDIETLKFKRGKLLKMLGEKYWEIVDKDASMTVAGTGEILRQIKGIDKEVVSLEKELAHKTPKSGKKASAKKPAPKKPAKKPAAKKTASPRTAGTRKAAPKKPAPETKTPPETTAPETE